MNLFRRLLPLFALVMGSVVTVQALDLVACADETPCADGHPEAAHAPHGDSEAMPDCFCHLACTSVAAQQVAERQSPAFEMPMPRGREGRADGARQRLDRPPRG